jgi:hypothetical protein
MNMMITMMMVFISDGTSTRTRIATPLMADFVAKVGWGRPRTVIPLH